ncbi:hypothetical protein ACH4E8_30645 [Streptomyces sp. NPDC017979]|uniref:hypothetical protein n=1 Tax=Streptomyces sp. NPDC017979 TaxID=3365024 RepID=UPI00378C62C4
MSAEAPAEPPQPSAPGPALELLVHGVGGTTPQEMLGDPRTVLVSGDEKAAVFRRADDVGAERDPARGRGDPVPEAYCWSNLTSGNGARALWLLLLPFMVANLAHWMRPRARGRVRTTRVYGALVRLVALSLTVVMTAAACEVALDLVAWQCAGRAPCTDGRSWIGFLAADRGGWWSQPGRRLALAALVPVALVGLLWYLSNRTWTAYESQRPPLGEHTPVADGSRRAPHNPHPEVEDEGDGDGEGEEDEHAGDREPDPQAPQSAVRFALGRPGFWYGRRHVARLRAAHTAAGFLTVAAAVTGAPAGHDRGGDSALLQTLGILLTGALALGACAVVWVVVHRGRSERRFDVRVERTAVTALPDASLTVLAGALVYASWSRPGWESHGTLPGELAFSVLTIAQGVLVVALAAVALRLHCRARHPRSVLGGLGGPAVAVLACALGSVMTGGTAQRVADWLDGPGTPGMDGDGSIPGPPVLLSWQASVIPVLLALLFLPALALAVRTWLTGRRLGGAVEREYERWDSRLDRGDPAARRLGDTGWRPDPVRTRRIAGARARAGLTDSAPLIVGVLAAATLLLGAAAVYGAWRSDAVPGRAFEGGFADSAAQAVQFLGSWLVGFGILLFVTWGRRAYRDPSARRTIGILWDVGTFWPRAAHPFAPPCYAERAVPDLTWRMSTWTAQTRARGGRLVISGHSQGSVLAASAVWQLPAETRGRVALLTYGSPLERLYGRWFPAYFGPEALRALRDEVHCWSNLWRPTDPIGGPVRVPSGPRPSPDRTALKDPVAYGRSERHPLPEPIRGHSDYQADPAFADARADLLSRIPGVPRQGRRRRGPRSGTDPRKGRQGSSGRSSG